MSNRLDRPSHSGGDAARPGIDRREFLAAVGAAAATPALAATAAASRPRRPARGRQSAVSPAVLTKLQSMLDGLREKYGIAGAGLAVLDGDNLHEFVAGVKDIR